MAKARRTARLSVQQMAEDLDLDRRTISGYENDQRPVRRSVLYAYAMRTGVPLWWLQGEDLEAETDASFRTGSR